MSRDALVVHRAERAWIGGSWRSADVVTSGESVVSIAPFGSTHVGAVVDEIPEGDVLLPGLVDSHVHVNEPGRTEWEGFASATRAAAAGGVTTIVDMPLNALPPTTTREALELKRRAADGQLTVDVGFWGGAVPENLSRLGALHRGGVFGFKCFLSPSGVDEFGHLDAAELRRALAEVASLDSVLLVHAEDPELFAGERGVDRTYRSFVDSRPPESERRAIASVISGVRETGARAHILHLSDAGSVALVDDARAEGLPITVETCPHYLVFDGGEIPDGASEFKCCPPIRDEANRDALWEAVVGGRIDAIVSDHSPSTPERKRAGGGDFAVAWGGISGLQLGLAAVWTEARRRGIELGRILPLFTTGPARVAGLEGLGEISVGGRADLVAFSPERETIVDAWSLEHRNPISAFHGRTLRGVVERTWLRGQVVFDRRGEWGHPRGALLERPGSRVAEADEPVDVVHAS
jgi:allantoinase